MMWRRSPELKADSDSPEDVRRQASGSPLKVQRGWQGWKECAEHLEREKKRVHHTPEDRIEGGIVHVHGLGLHNCVHPRLGPARRAKAPRA